MPRPDLNDIHKARGGDGVRAHMAAAKPFKPDESWRADSEYLGAGEPNPQKSRNRRSPHDEQPQSEASSTSNEAEITPFDTFDARDWQDQPIEPRLFTVLDWIPAGEPGLVSGDGGTGKTRLMLQLGRMAGLGRQAHSDSRSRACLLCRRAARANAPDRQGYPGLARSNILRSEARAALHLR